MNIGDYVEITKTSSNMDGLQGVISGVSARAAGVVIWIVTLNKSYFHESVGKVSTVTIPEVCLKELVDFG